MASRRMAVAEFLEWDSGDASGAHWQLRNGVPERIPPSWNRQGSIIAETTCLLLGHAHARDRGLAGVIKPGVVTSADSFLIPDIAMTRARPSGQIPVTDPIVLIEVLGGDREPAIRANVREFTAVPSVQEIVILHSTAIAAEILRRRADGVWPDQPELLGPDDELRLPSIGFTTPLREAYRTANL